MFVARHCRMADVAAKAELSSIISDEAMEARTGRGGR